MLLRQCNGVEPEIIMHGFRREFDGCAVFVRKPGKTFTISYDSDQTYWRPGVYYMIVMKHDDGYIALYDYDGIAGGPDTRGKWTAQRSLMIRLFDEGTNCPSLR